MIETLFKIAESYFKNNKQKFALIAEELIKSMCHDVKKFIELDKNLDFVEHVNEFFIKLMKFLISKVGFQNNLSQKINRIYQNVSDQNNELNVNEKLNNFQIMFVFCDDFEKIVEAMKFLEEKYGHNDWVDKTGYTKKDENLELTFNNFGHIGGFSNLFLNHFDLFDDQDSVCEDSNINSNVENLEKLLSLEIPQTHLKCFYDEHFIRCIKFTLTTNNISLMRKIFETLETVYKSNHDLLLMLESSRSEVQFLVNELFDIKDNTLKSLNKHYKTPLKPFIRSKDEELHQIFQSINTNANEKNLFRKLLNADEILKILLHYFEDIKIKKEINMKNFIEFFSDVFPRSFTNQSQGKCVHGSINETDKDHEGFKSQSQICFHVLNLISKIKCPLNDLELFFTKSFVRILRFGFVCRSIIDKIFEILVKNFNNEKSKVVIWIKKACDTSSFLNPTIMSNKLITDDCKSVVEYFWLRVFDFFISDEASLRNVLLSDYTFNQPLIIGIYYNIKTIQDFYIKNFSLFEIFSIFTMNLCSISRFFNQELYDEFFETYFLSEDKKFFLKSNFEENGHKIFASMNKKVERFPNGAHEDFETKKKNFSKYLHMFLNLSAKVDVQLFEALCLKEIDHLPTISRKYLMQSQNINDFFTFMFQDDVNVLDKCINVKFYRGETYTVSVENFAFEYFYSNLIENLPRNTNKEWIKKFMSIKCEPRQLHPLTFSLGKGFTHVINLYKANFSKEDIFRIFLENVNQLVVFPNIYESLKKLISDLFSEELFNEKRGLYVRKAISETNDDYESDDVQSEVMFCILNLLLHHHYHNCSLTEIENFFNEHLSLILHYAFRCFSIIEKFFEIMIKYFASKKETVIKFVKSNLDKTGFLHSVRLNNTVITNDCRKYIGLFFEELEKYFASNDVLMKKFLLNDYDFNHPLIIGIYYDIYFIKKLYFKYCEPKEILNVFDTESLDMIVNFFDKKNYKNFFEQYFVDVKQEHIQRKKEFYIFLSHADAIYNKKDEIINNNDFKEKQIKDFDEYCMLLKEMSRKVNDK